MKELNNSKNIGEKPITEQLSRRDTAKKLVRMAYVVPAVMAVIKTTERPAFAGLSGTTAPPPQIQ